YWLTLAARIPTAAGRRPAAALSRHHPCRAHPSLEASRSTPRGPQPDDRLFRPSAVERKRSEEAGMEGCSVNVANICRDDRTEILGVGVSSVNLDDAVARIERWISERSCNYVCVT